MATVITKITPNSFFPFLEKIFQKEETNPNISRFVGEDLGEAAYDVLNSKFKVTREDLLVEVDLALANINQHEFENEKQYKSDNFLLDYLTILMSLQNYLNSYGKDYDRIVRLSSPPKEAYEYVGHNKLNFKENKQSFALMYED